MSFHADDHVALLFGKMSLAGMETCSLYTIMLRKALLGIMICNVSCTLVVHSSAITLQYNGTRVHCRAPYLGKNKIRDRISAIDIKFIFIEDAFRRQILASIGNSTCLRLLSHIRNKN